jgi:hypothetical protein
MESQVDRIQRYLSNGKWHHVQSIMHHIAPGAVNVAVRSRISDLNKKLGAQGWEVQSRITNDGQAEYRLAKIGELPL